MRVSVCVGNYAAAPYCMAGLEIQVYCMEELCYCMRENAFLLDLSVLDEGLVKWIDEECGIKELAKELYPMVRKQGSLSAFVTMILEYTGLYDRQTMQEVEKVLKEGSGLSGIEKRKNQIDYLVRKEQYPTAVRRYDDLLSRWQEESEQGMEMPGARVRAGILHNKGVALAGMMEYQAAAECFREANEIEQNAEHYQAFLAAKRMELDESDYLSFIADQPGSYEQSLALEKQIDRLKDEFRESGMGMRLVELREWRFGSDKQRYYDELEKIVQKLKDKYRNSVSE